MEPMNTPAARNHAASVINETVQHLAKLLDLLHVPEREGAPDVFTTLDAITAEREPLAALLAQLETLRTPTALLPDGRLACGHCGNDDRGTLQICEYVLRTWDMPEIADDENDEEAGLLLDSGSDSVNWETSQDGEFLYCRKCFAESIIPARVEIEWK